MGTTHYGKAFWQEECEKIPEEAAYITLTIGTISDYFRPKEGKTFCEMLTCNLSF